MRFSAAIAVFALSSIVTRCEGRIGDDVGNKQINAETNDDASSLFEEEQSSRRTQRFGNGSNGNNGNGNNGSGNNGSGNGNSNDLLPDEVRLLVKYKDAQGKSDIARFGRNGAIDTDIPRFNLASIRAKVYNEHALRANPHIASVEKDETMYVMGWDEVGPFTEDETSRRLAESTPYGIDQVQANQLWNIPLPDPNADPIKICVVDTGYGLGHPDLPKASHGVAGWNAGGAPYGVWDVDGNSHGTHCAGTIGAIGSNGEGVVGVNPDPTKFRFFIGKGLGDSGSASTSNVMAAVEACATSGAKVISMSLGGGSYSSTYDSAYKEYYDDGILIVAAAGNDGDSSKSYPASYPHVMSVGATDSNENIAGYSQYNDQVEIAGPGSSVESTVTTNSGTQFTYGYKGGTSMATPHVAGVAALVWSHFPQCTNNQIRNVLIRTAKDKGASGCDNYYGFGIVQAKAAYDLLAAQGCGAGGPVTNPLSSDSYGGCAQDPDYTSPPTATPTPYECDLSLFQLDLETDRYGGETSWTLTQDSNGATVADGNGYGSSLSITERRCLPTAFYTFTIRDSWGDGICCSYGSGSYTVMWNGEVVGSGGAFTSADSVSFGSDVPQPTRAPTMSPTAKPTTASPTVSPTTASPTNVPTDVPSDAPSVSSEPSPLASESPSHVPSGSPTNVPTRTPTRAPILIWEEVITNDFETGWQDFEGGGGDAFRTTTRAFSGSYSLEIRDNSGVASSVTTSQAIDVSNYDELRVKFCFFANSMERNEDFWLQTSTNEGSWTTVKTWARGQEFNNGNWYVDETVSIQLQGYENTVGLRFRCDATGNGDNVYLDDVTVEGKLSVATTSEPTTSPTRTPTAVPTNAPTGVPTDAPTNAPTHSPTNVPTVAPSDTPSVSQQPSGAPTDGPTESPTDAPTKAPTDVPTKAPTDAPTTTPTDVPTKAPTDAPTKAPTDAPTDAPTKRPTASPTDSPTGVPTVSPTRSPTNVPTDSPSEVPSESLVPTSSPTVSPTRAPTDAPTNAPTNAPTMAPTDAPTNAPTNAPTKSPTVAQTATWIEIFSNDFETGWQDFNDGGDGFNDGRDDAAFSTSSTYANSGTNSLRIRDNSGTPSSVFSNQFAVSSYTNFRVDFHYYPRSMDNINEDFFLQYSKDGGGWITVKSWRRCGSGESDSNGGCFDNNVGYSDSVEFYPPGGASNIRIRFVCDASGNRDYVYIDDVDFFGYGQPSS